MVKNNNYELINVSSIEVVAEDGSILVGNDSILSLEYTEEDTTFGIKRNIILINKNQ